jgi:hypothetical protein
MKSVENKKLDFEVIHVEKRTCGCLIGNKPSEKTVYGCLIDITPTTSWIYGVFHSVKPFGKFRVYVERSEICDGKVKNISGTIASLACYDMDGDVSKEQCGSREWYRVCNEEPGYFRFSK